ncbi:MAG: hypothetical protein ABI199_01825 [Bacteroidia bacterium]
MKKSLALIALLALCMAFKPNSKNDEIIWSPDRKLTWKDFEKPLSKYAPEAAGTNSGIDYSLKPIDNLSIKVGIYDIFFKSLSSKSLDKSHLINEILEHEQGHFDINELYARMLRKQLQDSSYINYNQFKIEFYKMYRSVDGAANSEEDKYDKETNHSIDTTMQNKWSKYIAEQLNAYAAYSQTEFVITYGKK